MKKTILAFFAAFCLLPLSAQTFRPFTELRTIKTAKFDIVFSERSRATAEALSLFADRAYERVSSLLGIGVPGRIPVTITPDSDLLNGYTNMMPFPHIVLYDAPMDSEWTAFPDALEGLFLHELTHAVSLSTRGPAAAAFHRLFGGWATPSFLTAPLFMVEGVTVSFESLGGFGRVNDPLVKERIAQAVEDGAFLTPFQASGVYDKPPYGNAYYQYGGLFSAYLQKRWGMETYAKLWKEMGNRLPLSLRFYHHGFYRIFRDVYGEDFLAVWKEFADSMHRPSLEDNRANLLVGGERSFDTLRTGGGRAFFADAVAGAVFAYDPADGRIDRILPIDAYFSDFDVSADGSRLLAASYRYRGAVLDAVVVEYEVSTGRRTGRSWKGLLKPRYFRDGVVGIAASGIAAPLVFRDSAGAESVLLSGDTKLVFSAPAALDSDRIAYAASENGVRFIGVYDFRTRSAYRLGAGGGKDAELFRYVRDLRAQDGKLYFSYAEEDGFYKLGAADESGFLLSDRSFSGGVFAPVEISGSLYYRGEFSTWDALLRYPEPAESLSGTRFPLVAEPAAVGVAAFGSGFAAAVRPGVAPPSAPFPESRYFAPAYLNPARFWVPYPLFRTDGKDFRVDGGGVLSYLVDPTDTDFLILQGGWDTAGKMPFASLDWVSYGFGFPLSVSASDGIEFTASGGLDDLYRATRASLSAGIARGIGGERVSYSLSASASALLYAYDRGDGSSAYSWTYEPAAYAVGAAFGLSSLRRPLWRLFGDGASAEAYAYRRLSSASFRAETVLRAAFEPALPLRLTAYGVWDEGGTAVDGTSLVFGSASFDGMVEYASFLPDDLRLVAGGEAELKLFTLETQGSFSHLYFNRFFGVLSWRGAGYGDGPELSFVQSAALKFGAVVSALPLADAPVRFSPYVLGVWKLSSLDDGDALNDYYLGFLMSIEW